MSQRKKQLIAYCGLYCGDCFSFQGEIADLARDLRKSLRKAKFDRIAQGIPFKEFEHYDKCYGALGAMVRLRCKKACRGGGGNPFCTIRKCCKKKDFDGCWQCDDFSTCRKLMTLSPIRRDKHLKNLRKIRKVGITGFLGSMK